MRLPVLKLAPVVVVLGLAACGSSTTTSSPATASSSSSAAATSAATTGASDAICAQYNTQINAITPTPPADPQTVSSASDLAPVAAWMDAVLPAAMQEQTALNAAADSAPIKGAFADVVTTFQGADTAAKGSDPNAFKTEWANFKAAQNAFFGAATGANMPNCAK